MPKLDGKEVTILRIAGEKDDGYNPFIEKVFIRADNGEYMVDRSAIDETDDGGQSQDDGSADSAPSPDGHPADQTAPPAPQTAPLAPEPPPAS